MSKKKVNFTFRSNINIAEWTITCRRLRKMKTNFMLASLIIVANKFSCQIQYTTFTMSLTKLGLTLRRTISCYLHFFYRLHFVLLVTNDFNWFKYKKVDLLKKSKINLIFFNKPTFGLLIFKILIYDTFRVLGSIYLYGNHQFVFLLVEFNFIENFKCTFLP